MSTVLHPVGPEPEERYWVRRVAVLAGILVALVAVIALVVNATSAGSAVQAAPAPPAVPVTAPAPSTPTPSATPTSSAAATVTPTAEPAATPTTSAAPTVLPPTTRPTPTATPSFKVLSTASLAGARARTVAQAQADARAQSTARPAKKPEVVLAACPTGKLRTTLTGKPRLTTGDKATFALSLINGSGQTCFLNVTHENFTLTVVSGSDRIWTTRDCATTVPTLSPKLKAEQAVGWKVVWNGQRSKNGCKNAPEKPKAGYYVAIASFDNAKPVRFRVVLHA